MTERYDVASTEPAAGHRLRRRRPDPRRGRCHGHARRHGDLGRERTSTGDLSNSGIAVALRPRCACRRSSSRRPARPASRAAATRPPSRPSTRRTTPFNNTNTVEPGARIVRANDEAGNAPLQTTVTFKRDVTAPLFCERADGRRLLQDARRFPSTTTTATDMGSGLDATTYAIERDSGTVNSGACTWNNTWVTVTLTAGSDNDRRSHRVATATGCACSTTSRTSARQP